MVTNTTTKDNLEEEITTEDVVGDVVDNQ